MVTYCCLGSKHNFKEGTGPMQQVFDLYPATKKQKMYGKIMLED